MRYARRCERCVTHDLLARARRRARAHGVGWRGSGWSLAVTSCERDHQLRTSIAGRGWRPLPALRPARPCSCEHGGSGGERIRDQDEGDGARGSKGALAGADAVRQGRQGDALAAIRGLLLEGLRGTRRLRVVGSADARIEGHQPEGVAVEVARPRLRDPKEDGGRQKEPAAHTPGGPREARGSLGRSSLAHGSSLWVPGGQSVCKPSQRGHRHRTRTPTPAPDPDTGTGTGTGYRHRSPVTGPGYRTATAKDAPSRRPPTFRSARAPGISSSAAARASARRAAPRPWPG